MSNLSGEQFIQLSPDITRHLVNAITYHLKEVNQPIPDVRWWGRWACLCQLTAKKTRDCPFPPHLKIRTIQDKGTTYWYIGIHLGREGDLPAVEWASGTKEWYKNGLRHRDGDLPAVVAADGTQQWWKNGKSVIL